MEYWNRRGLVPGPSETEAEFLARVEKAKGPYPCWNGIEQERCGGLPDWVEVTYSNHGLPFWQGAVTIVDGAQVTLQFRTAFGKGSYLGLYSKEEVLLHEAVHAIRMAFHEPRFEEMLAYATSSSPFRRFLGPIFFRSWESSLFAALLCAACLLQFFTPQALWIPAICAFFGLIRLGFAHLTLRRCLKKIPFALALRLTDKEIESFASSSPEEISRYAYQESTRSFRWRMLHTLYFEGKR